MPITISKILVLAIHFLSLITNIIHVFFIRRILIITQNQNLQKNNPLNFEKS